jgi:hypothetical protein
MYDWSKSFKGDQIQVENMPHATCPRTSVNQANVEQINVGQLLHHGP